MARSWQLFRVCEIKDCGRVLGPKEYGGLCGRHREARRARENPRCSFPGCANPSKATNGGLCQGHHWQSERGYELRPLRKKVYRGPRCNHPGCPKPSNGQGFCGGHRDQMRRYGRTWDIHRRSVWDHCRYDAAHRRVHAQFGRAADNLCIECGELAADWAYDHTDPTELHEDRGMGIGLLFYSRFPEFYAPMCKKCHKVADTRRVAAERASYREFLRKERAAFVVSESVD